MDSAWKESYACWLQYKEIDDASLVERYASYGQRVAVGGVSPVLQSAANECVRGMTSMIGVEPTVSDRITRDATLIIGTKDQVSLEDYGIRTNPFPQLPDDGYVIQTANVGGGVLLLLGKTDRGALYAVHHLLRLMQLRKPVDELAIAEGSRNNVRMINHWDNMDGSVERGYAGQSIFFENGKFADNLERLEDYARLLSSVGINAISVNNVNVGKVETRLITEDWLPEVARVADLFRAYGIQIFLSINYASPVEIGGLSTADPLDPAVQEWWSERVANIYRFIPDFGGFLVKADSEHRPGPFTYGRNHAEGANMLGEALRPFGGLVIWRCFVYDCQQDWRDRSTDRARAAYDHFKPLDGAFLDNVILQVKNGPMDFQVREPVSPLFGAMPQTNQVIELQITQEYTGQQKDLCYLVPQWKEILDFDTYARGKGSTVKSVVDGSLFNYAHSGMAAVSNVGRDLNWTGHTLAQANLYGYGRLAWNPEMRIEDVTDEWVRLTFGHDSSVVEQISKMLRESWRIYENYTAPLGVGWMVNPGHHYGPNVDGYEYSVWGTYHFADRDGVGVDRTVQTGTGFTAQYFSPNAEMYESLETCPDELLLFFHHVPYTHRLKSGETVIQHIYNTHFEGVEQVQALREGWRKLKGKIDALRFHNVEERLEAQLANAREWRDQINTYFYRKSGIPDEKNRTIYK